MEHNPALQTMHDRAGPALYRAIRAQFVARGLSLNAWCAKNDVKREYARKVLLGTNPGPKARELRDRIIAAAFRQSA